LEREKLQVYVILAKARINQKIKTPFLALLNEKMGVCFSPLPWGEDWERDAKDRE
jgi:hypothetical protein